MVSKVDRFSNFTNQTKVNRLRTKQDIANVLCVDSNKLDDVYVLYLSEQNIPTKLTLYEFAQFVTNDILTDSKYASMVTPNQRADLAKLKTFSNKNVTDTSKTAAELSNIFGIDQKTLEQLLVYYGYTTNDAPTASASIEELVDFALSNQNVIDEMGLSADEVSQLKGQFADAKNKISELKNTPAVFDQAVAELPAETQEALAPQIASIRAELVSKVGEAEKVLTKRKSLQ
jgi:hypothetical protein